jgi:hypothetical protein
MKTITITLNPEQEKFFNELKYSLMDIDANNSDVINHALMELLLFEEFTGDQVTNYLNENYQPLYQDAINTRDFGKKFKPVNP